MPYTVNSVGLGSSPLARGLLILYPAVAADSGIIPARAGFTRMCVICHASVWDHPRSRGVYPAGRL